MDTTTSDTIETAVKKCSRCGEEKPLTEFYINRHQPNGLTSACKSCTKKYVVNRNRIVQQAHTVIDKHTVNKYCQRCGLLKAASEFHKNAGKSDGLDYWCKKCRNRYNKAYKNLGTPAFGTGIDDWLQVDSVLRTMAELRHDTNCTKAECEKRISTIRAEHEKGIESAAEKIKCFNGMIAQFARKHCPEHETIVRQFRFGTVQVYRGDINVELRVDYAGAMRGKP